MILGQVIAGPWSESGLGAFESGKDFNCTSTACYGITKPGEAKPGSVHQTFMSLQRAINRWSGKAKFTPLVVDGLIGHSTVEALQKAGSAALSTLPMGVKQVAQTIFAKSLTKENTAMNALSLTESLNSAADQFEAAGNMPAPRSPAAPSAPAPAPAPTTSTAPTTAPSAEGKGNLLYWILGGFAVVATAGIATVVVLRRRKPQRGAGVRALKARGRAAAY